MADHIGQVDQFLSAIREETEKLKQDTKRQTRMLIANELEKAEDKVLKESYRFIQTRAAQIRKEQGRRVSRAAADCEKQYLIQREKMMDEVENKVASMISEYRNTQAYAEFLIKSAGEIGREFNDRPFVLFAAPFDEKFQSTLLQESKAAELKYDSSIKLGGLRAENEEHTLCLDDSLDVRLHEGKELLRGLVNKD